MNKLGLQSDIIMLFVGIFTAAGLMLYCEHFFKDDGQVFQVMAGLVTGFSGALFTKLKGDTPKPPDTVPNKEDKPNV